MKIGCENFVYRYTHLSDATTETIRLVFFKNTGVPYFTATPGVSVPPTIPNDYPTTNTARFIAESFSSCFTNNSSQPSGISINFTITLETNDYLNLAIDMYTSGGNRNIMIFAHSLTITEL